MDRVTDFESVGKYLVRRGCTENRVVGSLQSPIFGGFLPLSIPASEKVDLVGLERPTGICSKCSIEKNSERFPLQNQHIDGVNPILWNVDQRWG